MIYINEQLSIADHEVWFTASRSGGAGGQNVNKVNSKVTLWFDLAHSPSLNDDQRRLLKARLGHRLSQEGILQIHSQEHRSQLVNRQEALERFVVILCQGLYRPPVRKATRVPRRAVEARIGDKLHQQKIRSNRTKRDWVSDSGY